MEFTASKKDLLALVGQAQGASDKKSAMPVLANVLLTANGGKLNVAATDLYLGITGSCAAEIVKNGSLALPARDLLDRIKMMPDGPIQIMEKENNCATVKAVGAPRRYTLHGMPGSEFPKLPDVAAGSPTFELATATLAQLIARTHFSISTDETRAHVNCALFEWVGDRVRMVTTDGHRLSKIEVKLEGKKHETVQMLIPLRALLELKRLVDSVRGIESIRIQQSGATAFFHIGEMLFSLKTVDAQFPPYHQVIPSYVQHTITVPRGALADAVRAVSIAASDRMGGVKLVLENGMLRVSSESPESGNGFDEVPVDAPAEAKANVGMNAKYVLDMLGALNDDEVAIGLSGELDPITVRQLDPANQDSVYVGMPMRI